jgi:uncharacterized protein YcfJ
MKKMLFLFSVLVALLFTTTNTMAQHRRMSSRAKGALIGGAAGAVAGGLIGHGVGGALVGGAIGAGGGYVIGNEHHRHEVKRRVAYYRAHHRYTHSYAVRH